MNMDRITHLLQACAQGDTDTVQVLLDEGVHIDSYDEEETTPLQMAAAFGQEKVACTLLSRGASLDLPNAYGWTPLMHAARHGHSNIMALLLQNKAKVNLRNKLGVTALTMAVRSGQMASVRLLLDAGIDIHSSEIAQCAVTDLMVATQNGLDPLVKLLLDRGADVNYKAPSTGYTALMYAAKNGHKTITQILVERGADVNLVNICDKTALDISSQQGRRAVKAYLENKTKKRQISDDEQLGHNILEATKNGNFERVRDLLAEDPSQKDAASQEDGATPLMYASMLGQLDLVKLLVQMEANLNAKDTVSGWTALMQAIFHGKNNIAKFLIEAGADVNIRALNGCTAFDLASLVEEADAELIRLLASRTLHFVDEAFISQSSSNNNFPEIRFTGEDEINPSKGLKAWLHRVSSHFNHLKHNRIVQSPNSDVDIAQESLLKNINKRTPNIYKKKSTVKQKGKEKTSPTSLTSSSSSPFTLALPSVTLISDSMGPVIPPMLLSPSMDLTTSPNRNRMPPGKFNSPSPMLLSSPNPPSWATNCFSTTLGSNSGSPNNSLQLGNHSPQSSGESSNLAPGLSNIRKNLKAFLPDNEKSSDLSHVEKHLENIGSNQSKLKHSVAPQDFLESTCPYDFSLTLSPRKKSSSSKSSRSSKSSSTLTPSHSEIGDKSSGSDSGQLGSTTTQVTDENDEVNAILKKLSLEKYQPIFEAQEVDFEAFLSLTDNDLMELGVQPTESRQQILTAIDEVSGNQRDSLPSTTFPSNFNHSK